MHFNKPTRVRSFWNATGENPESFYMQHCTSVQLDPTLYPEQTWEDEPTEYTLVKTTEDETPDFVSDTVFGRIDVLKKLINEEVRKAYSEGYEAGLAAAKH